MPVLYRHEANLVIGTDTILGQNADANPRGHQIQSRLGGVDGAEDFILALKAAGPLAEGADAVAMEVHL